MSVKILYKFNNQLLVPSFKSLTSDTRPCWHANSVENEHISPKNSLKISLKFCQFSITAARFSGPHRSSVTVCFGLSVFFFFYTKISPSALTSGRGRRLSPWPKTQEIGNDLSFPPHQVEMTKHFWKKKHLNNYSNSWNFQLGLLCNKIV